MPQRLACLCYVIDGDNVLMLYRNKRANDVHEGKRVTIGGKVDPGESPLECVKREVMEESGLIVTNPVQKGHLTFPAGGIAGDTDWHVFVFVATEFEGTLNDESNEGRLERVPIDEVMSLPMQDGDYVFTPYVFGPGRFSAKLIYDGSTLADHEVTIHD